MNNEQPMCKDFLHPFFFERRPRHAVEANVDTTKTSRAYLVKLTVGVDKQAWQ